MTDPHQWHQMTIDEIDDGEDLRETYDPGYLQDAACEDHPYCRHTSAEDTYGPFFGG